MFILILQFFWLYIDDLMGKGLEIFIILELLFYVSAGLIPLALPLAILLSSLVTFGNLSEKNELTALKSSGLSLYLIIRPLFVVVLLIAFGTFYFANYIIPVANLKWHTLIYDIQNTKISTLFIPGTFTKELDGYAIKINESKNDIFYDITINDHTNPKQLRIVKAEEGITYKSTNGQYLIFKLKNGRVFEELDIQNPNFLPNGQPQPNNIQLRKPERISSFESGTYKLNLSGFTLNRSQEDFFGDKHEMMNVSQIKKVTDSISLIRDNKEKSFSNLLIQEHQLINNKLNKNNTAGIYKNNDLLLLKWDSLPKLEKINIYNQTISKLRDSNNRIINQKFYLKKIDYETQQYWIEFHRKFALTYSIIILFMVGASLGAKMKRGGYGTPVIFATTIFLIYFILITAGSKLANDNILSPFVGMWLSGIVFTPVAFIITRAAANDSEIFNKEAWNKILLKIRFKK